MHIIGFLPHLGKKTVKHFAEELAGERNTRIAREYLSDLMVFHAQLEDEIQAVLAREEHRGGELLARMVSAKETYLQMMHSLKHADHERQSHAMTIFADAVQDLIASMQKEWRH